MLPPRHTMDIRHHRKARITRHRLSQLDTTRLSNSLHQFPIHPTPHSHNPATLQPRFTSLTPQLRRPIHLPILTRLIRLSILPHSLRLHNSLGVSHNTTTCTQIIVRFLLHRTCLLENFRNHNTIKHSHTINNTINTFTMIPNLGPQTDLFSVLHHRLLLEAW